MILKAFTNIATMTLLLLSFASMSSAQNVKAPSANASELHGGIEIGPKVVRILALRISNSEEGYNVKILHSNSVALATSYPQDGKITPAYVRDLAQAVQKSSDILQKDFQIPQDQIHIVGLSDITPQQPDELIGEIRSKTGKTINFLTSETEVQLSIAGIIPRKYQSANKWYDNRGNSLLIDIDNVTTRGGYQQLRRTSSGAPDYDYVTWGVPRGAVNFAADVQRAAGEQADYQAFARRAQAMSAVLFRNPIKAQASQKPGMMTRRKVYLTGGVVSAMATLLHPEDQRPYIPLTMGDIETFYNRAVADPESLLNPDLSKIRDEGFRKEVRERREAIKQSFPPKTLIAGAELLKSLAADLNFQEKTLIYPRYSYLARILSYVRLQPE